MEAPFTPGVNLFADKTVMAIGNVRLFNEIANDAPAASSPNPLTKSSFG